MGGQSHVPLKHFHIPALILGGNIAARRDARLVSQIDLPVTLLSLAGVSAQHPMIGHDLTQPDTGGRARITPMSSSYKSTSGWVRIWRALGYSIQGLRAAFRCEAAFRQELLLVALLTPCAFWLGRAKDLGSAAVLLTMLIAAALWLTLLFTH